MKDEPRSLIIGKQQFYQQPSPIQQQIVLGNQDYFSLLCRNGPLPQKYHKMTDIFCLVSFILLFIGMIILITVNGLNFQHSQYLKQDQLKSDIFYGSRFFLFQIVLTALSIMIISMTLALLTIYLPGIMAFFSIIALYSLSILFLVMQFRLFFTKKNKYYINLFKGIISLILIIIFTLVLLRRKQRIKNLSLFLKLPSLIIKSNLCKIFTHMILLSLIEIALWYGFANLYFSVATSGKPNSKFIKFLTKLAVALVWFWTSGALIAFSDYFVTSFTVHWFYNISKQDESNFNSELKYSSFAYSNDPSDQIEEQSISKDKYQSQIFTPIYKKLFSQIGTIIFGSILAYLPLYLISKIKKIVFKSSNKAGIASFSKYGYLDTIMEWQNFITANQRIYNLRHRIKSVMPQVYMLGHMYSDFTKLALILISFAGFHLFIDLNSQVARHFQYFLQYLITVLIFGIGLCTQIVTNFTNLIGKCGDMAFFLYCIDLQIQRVHYANNSNYSTPKSLIVILRQLTIKRNWNQDK